MSDDEAAAEAEPAAEPQDEPAGPPQRKQPEQLPEQTPQQVVDDFHETVPRHKTDRQLMKLAELKEPLRTQIVNLDASDSTLSRRGLETLPAFPALESVNLSGTQLTNADLEALGKLTGLRSLLLNRVKIDSNGLKHIAGLTELQVLGLNNTGITEQSFEHLREMAALQVLMVSGDRVLQGVGFAELVQRNVLDNLRELHANGTSFGYFGVPELPNLPALEVVHLVGAQISDNQVKDLAACRGLREISLQRNLIGNNSLQLLARLKALEKLLVNECVGIDDAGLKSLRRMQGLRHLDLSGTRCTPAAVKALKEKFLKETTIVFGGQTI